jgi:hypothetical protein
MGDDHTGASSTLRDRGIVTMIQQLGLTEDHLDDIVFEEEGPPPAEETRWLAIAQFYIES